MNPKEIYRVGDFSIGFYKNHCERLIDDISYNSFKLKSIKKARKLATDYAQFQWEIAAAEYRPIEETGIIGKKLLDHMRWDLALNFALYDQWQAMAEEVWKDAQDLLESPNSYEDVRKGYILQQLAESLKP